MKNKIVKPVVSIIRLKKKTQRAVLVMKENTIDVKDSKRMYE
jgi:hypothetical protein